MAARDRRSDRLTCRRCGEAKGRAAFRLGANGKPKRRCRQCENYLGRVARQQRSVEEASRPLPETKACVRCGQDRPIEEYGWRTGRSYNRSARCQRCESICARAARHGVTPEWIEGMIERQAGCCSICGRPAHLRVDHDHATGEKRGMICHNCNAGLGHFQDDPDVLLAAATYLLQHVNVLVRKGG